MAEISASDVKKLREQTGAGMMECKKALVDTDGDFAKAEKLLKEKGLAAVEKRSDRATNQGKIFIKTAGTGEEGSAIALVELVSETDFVARNPDFISLGGAMAGKVLEKGYTEPNEELNGMVSDLAAKIRENMGLRRVNLVKAGPGEYITSYIHGEGAIGVVVKLASDNAEALKKDEVKELAHNLALHVSWANPSALDRDKVDPAYIKENEDIFRKQMETDESLKGKPEKVLEGILSGKVGKFLKSICLMDQPFVKDEKFTVSQVLLDAGKAAGARFSIAGYVYFKVGA
ncbi:MAG: translation elongation factor Ts [Treponema sp.]|jgi:elongation factor Ts|nr:translation elongation factor Ts [Treponema sp.]